MPTQYILVVLMLVIAQGRPAPTLGEQQKPQPFVSLNLSRGTRAEAIEALLTEARMPGGIVSVNSECSQNARLDFAIPSVDLREALNRVLVRGRTGSWDSEDGTIVAILGTSRPKVLDAVVREFEFDSSLPLSLSAQRLFASQEVREIEAKEGLEEMTTPLGFSSVPNDREMRAMGGEQKRRVVARGKTVLQILNMMAQSEGNAVWYFEQFACKGKTLFRVSWPVT